MHGAVVVGFEPHDGRAANLDEGEALDPRNVRREESARLSGETLARPPALVAPPAVGDQLDEDLPREVDAETVFQPEHLAPGEGIVPLLADLTSTARIERLGAVAEARQRREIGVAH